LTITSFLGEYEVTLDAKGRFLLPAGVKKQIPEEEQVQFVINRGFEKCLSLYPINNWKPLYAKIMGLNEFDSKAREFRRYFLNGATAVEPDTAGRLLIPPSLRQYGALEKDVVLVSAGDKIEIWNSSDYKKLFDNFSSDVFSTLAEQVMGNAKDKDPQG